MPGKQVRLKSYNPMIPMMPLDTRKPLLSLFSLIIAAALFAVPADAAAPAQENATIENIKLANTRDDLLTYFDVKRAFTEKINQAVLNGIPTTFSFYVDLYHLDDSWFDKKIADIQIKSTVKYNPLKKEFTVQRPGKKKIRSSRPHSMTQKPR